MSSGWLHEVQWVLCSAFWGMHKTDVYVCLSEAVCDFTTAPSHLKITWEIPIKKYCVRLSYITKHLDYHSRYLVSSTWNTVSLTKLWRSFTFFQTASGRHDQGEGLGLSLHFQRFSNANLEQEYSSEAKMARNWSGEVLTALFFIGKKNQHGDCTGTTHLVTCMHTHRFCPQPNLLSSSGHGK